MWPLISPAFGTDTAAWYARDPTRRVQRLVASGARDIPAIFLDCGTEDGLVDQMRAFRYELDRLGTPARIRRVAGEARLGLLARARAREPRLARATGVGDVARRGIRRTSALCASALSAGRAEG